MQLANQSGEPGQKMSPYLRAALIDSLFETSAPLLIGLFFGAIAAAVTAVKTGEPLIWACVALLIVAAAIRAFDLRRYHADERGTREYNIALGARRAQSVRSYLASRGIDANRMRTISYGKERPVAVCNDISCWSQNRRAVTVLNAGA